MENIFCIYCKYKANIKASNIHTLCMYKLQHIIENNQLPYLGVWWLGSPDRREIPMLDINIILDKHRKIYNFNDWYRPDHVVCLHITFTKWLISILANQEMFLLPSSIVRKLINMLKNIKEVNMSVHNKKHLQGFTWYLDDFIIVEKLRQSTEYTLLVWTIMAPN